MRHQLPCDTCARAGKVMVSMYRCPRCFRTSCSLACVKAHKSNYSCDGLRNRAASVPKRDYTEAHLMSDYTLLEDARRAVDAANAARPRHYRDHRAPKKTVYPDAIPRRRMELLAREAAKRGIDLRFMPSMFLRHRRNASNVRPVVLKEDGTGEDRPFDRVMLWSMEVVFWGKDGGTRIIKISDVDEDTPMKQVLDGAIASLKIKKDRLSGKEDPYIDFLDIPPEKVSAFLKNEIGLIKRLADAPIKLPDVYLRKAKRRKMADGVHVETYDMEHDTKKFNQLETESSVRESLYGRSIVEYPIVHIVVKGSQEEKQMMDQLRDLFEKPEPGASEYSASEEEKDYKPEDGELKEDGGDDTPMPDASQASQEGNKIASGDKNSNVGSRDSSKTGMEANHPTKKVQNEENQGNITDSETVKNVSAEKKGADSQRLSNPRMQSVGVAEASTLGLSSMKDTDSNAFADEGTSQERETAANGSISSLQDIEPLPSRYFYGQMDKAIVTPKQIASGPPPRGGKEPIVRAKDSDSEYDDEESVSGSESEAESEKNGVSSFADKKPVRSDTVTRVGKRKSRFSDLQTNNEDREEAQAEDEEDAPPPKRQEQVAAGPVDGAVERQESEAEEEKHAGGKEAPGKKGNNADKSPPLPFAFEYDSALLSDRIPRRKKITGSGSLPILKSC